MACEIVIERGIERGCAADPHWTNRCTVQHDTLKPPSNNFPEETHAGRGGDISHSQVLVLAGAGSALPNCDLIEYTALAHQTVFLEYSTRQSLLSRYWYGCRGLKSKCTLVTALSLDARTDIPVQLNTFKFCGTCQHPEAM